MFPAKIASVEYEKTLGADPSLLLITVLRVVNIIKPRHEISNNIVCAASKASDQPAHMRSLTRAFASRLNFLLVLSY